MAIEHLSENTLGSINPSSLYVQLKLTLDVLTAAALLPLVALVCGVAAIFIKLDSPGPVLFSQERIGYRGRVFRVFKLRTMQANTAGTHYTESQDPRITRVGAFLRKYQIDELPQIVNILKGEMSWIGPRPEALPLAEWYERRARLLQLSPHRAAGHYRLGAGAAGRRRQAGSPSSTSCILISTTSRIFRPGSTSSSA